MNNTLKIRFLLLLLILCFAGTAVTIHYTYQEKEILQIDGRKLEDNLHKKEAIVKKFIYNDNLFEKIPDIEENPSLKTYIIESLGEKNGIYVYTYSNNDLIFWGSEQIVPRSDAGIAEGSSIITWNNGWYESYKRSSGGFSVICLIPIKANYPITNRLLKNDFSDDLIKTSNLEIASYNDVSVFNVRNSEGEYLLSLKLRDSKFNTLFSVIEVVMWLLAAFTTIILINMLCLSLAKKGWVKVSVLIFALSLFLLRYADLKTQWIATNFFSGFFDPRVYASSNILPSLGSLFLHIVNVLWLVCYIHHCRYDLKIAPKTTSKYIQFIVFFASAVAFDFLCNLATSVFGSLVTDSSISFEFNDLLNLNIYSWVGILLLCLALLILYFVIEILLVIINSLQITKRRQVLFFSVTALIFLVVKLWSQELTISFFFLVLILYLKGWYVSNNSKFNLAGFMAMLFLFAGIASIKLNKFEERKQQDNQLLALQKLESSEDPNAVLLFLDIEKAIVDNEQLIDYLEDPQGKDSRILNDELRKAYFSGYLSKYDFYAYIIDVDSQKNDPISLAKLSNFKDLVIDGSRKVTSNFYRSKSNVGYINYFALLPILVDDEQVGTYIVELKNKSLGRYVSYPEVLFNGTIESTHDYDIYSYAYYRNGSLKRQHGEFLYPIQPDFYPERVRQYVKYNDRNGYNHMVFSPTEEDLLILSSKVPSTWKQLASLSFLFLVFLSFSILIYMIRSLTALLYDYDFNFRNLRWSVMIFQNRILYSTRIQAFVVLAVVGTLVIAGIITFFSLVDQYRIQQESAGIKQLSQISRGLETELAKTLNASEREQEFNWSSEINATDLNLYDSYGELIYTTQNKIYDLGLVSRFMNAKAWLNMRDYAREEFIHRETIGNLSYLVAYTPLKNDNNETIGYLSLPYFSNQKDLDQKVGLLLNTIINVYAIVLVALGLFAVFVANKITSPLSLVQTSLARTTIGKINEPIFWKRNDEIGSLIKEYNNMILALDRSANRIMRSERESAWREMAKQVAHEIKNPLTPLRLGVQLLERAWREKDPNFDDKFVRFCASFIEQIESLNRIASEFSNFAKMPDTKLDDVEIVDVIEKSMSLYNSNQHLSIELMLSVDRGIIVHGDRDQLLRTFNNLIKNALEARIHHQKCLVVIEVKPREFNQIAISVKDFGKGIDEIVQGKLFQPNFTTKSSGTGLGLAFVKQTVESMGGTIDFETARDLGTTFIIVLPLKIRINEEV